MGTPKKGPKSCLKVNEIDFTKKKSTARNKYASKSPPTTSSKERHPPERDANRNQKEESSKTEGQKAAPIKKTTKTTPYSHKTYLGHMHSRTLRFFALCLKINKTHIAIIFYLGHMQ